MSVVSRCAIKQEFRNTLLYIAPVTSPVEGVTFVTGATSQVSWRLTPHSSTTDCSTAGENIPTSGYHGNTLRESFPLVTMVTLPLLLCPEATMTFSDDSTEAGSTRRGSRNVVLVPQDVEESGGEVMREEQRTSKTFTISVDKVLSV